MTLQHKAFLSVLLFFSLFIYLFFRPENTVANALFIKLFSEENYLLLRESIQNAFAPGPFIIYSLPEGLWVCCITITSSFFYWEYRKKHIPLIYLPILFAIGLELLQLLGITNGTFDFNDLFSAFLFWLFPFLVFRKQGSLYCANKSLSIKHFSLYFSYAIVYLAHVSY